MYGLPKALQTSKPKLCYI